MRCKECSFKETAVEEGTENTDVIRCGITNEEHPQSFECNSVRSALLKGHIIAMNDSNTADISYNRLEVATNLVKLFAEYSHLTTGLADSVNKKYSEAVAIACMMLGGDKA